MTRVAQKGTRCSNLSNMAQDGPNCHYGPRGPEQSPSEAPWRHHPLILHGFHLIFAYLFFRSSGLPRPAKRPQIWFQYGPQCPQECRKKGPLWPKSGPIWPMRSPRRPKRVARGAKTAQEGPGAAQDSPRDPSAQNGLRRAQDGPSTAPRGPQEGPKTVTEAPKTARRDFKLAREAPRTAPELPQKASRKASPA